MKKILLIVLGVLLSASVFALSTSIEVDCCGYLGHWEDYYGGNLERDCPELNLTEEKCKPIMEGFGKLTTWYAGELEKAAYMRDAKRALIGLGLLLFAFILWRAATRKTPKKKRK